MLQVAQKLVAGKDSYSWVITYRIQSAREKTMNHLITMKCHLSQNNSNKQSPWRGSLHHKELKRSIQWSLLPCEDNGPTYHCTCLHFPRPAPARDLSPLRMNDPDGLQSICFQMFLYLNIWAPNHYLISKRKHINALNNCLINKSTKNAALKKGNTHCDKSLL